jgi:hypothetical protein
MSEHHRIVGEARGEPLGDRVAVRVLMRLSGCPSERWSRDLSARLANELVGHPAVGHLRLNNIVRGDQLVLEGVEPREMQTLAAALRRAIDATNHACPDDERSAGPADRAADAIAQEIAAGVDPAA